MLIDLTSPSPPPPPRRNVCADSPHVGAPRGRFHLAGTSDDERALGSAAPPSRARARTAAAAARSPPRSDDDDDFEPAPRASQPPAIAARPVVAARRAPTIGRDRRFPAALPRYAELGAAELGARCAALGLEPRGTSPAAQAAELERVWLAYDAAHRLARARAKADARAAPAAAAPAAAAPVAARDPRAGWPTVSSAEALRPLVRRWLCADRALYERILTFDTVDLADVVDALERAAVGARTRAKLSRPLVCALLDGLGVSYQVKWRAQGGRG
jgi:hypothetical protein